MDHSRGPNPLPPAPLRPRHPLPWPEQVLVLKRLVGESEALGGRFAALLADMCPSIDCSEDRQIPPE